MRSSHSLAVTVLAPSSACLLGRELAVVHNYEVGSNVIDGQPTQVRMRATNLYRKEDGKWKMIGHHTDLLGFLEE